jgi:hypothetical protein
MIPKNLHISGIINSFQLFNSKIRIGYIFCNISPNTAIYGARGANGFFLITTKGGKNTQGKTTVTYR